MRYGFRQVMELSVWELKILEHLIDGREIFENEKKKKQSALNERIVIFPQLEGKFGDG